ncbi:MAG TPA: hypothetical protein VFA45_15890 [Actinomycetes bacterium]|nr:hypothetical protein [Actinomycetes bacterium]
MEAIRIGVVGDYRRQNETHLAIVTAVDHAEVDPNASRLVVSGLACSLVGQTMDVRLVEGSLAHRAYGRASATERYYCQFGLNPEYLDALTASGFAVSGVDQDGEVRIVELPGHRFFVGTLFVPQTSSTPAAPHPLIGGYLAAAASTHRRVAGVPFLNQ